MIKFSLLLFAQLVVSLPHASAENEAVDCGVNLEESDDSTKSGVLMHGEHWVDLILRQGGRADFKPTITFASILTQLVREIGEGRVARVNEKIDGSPSVVFGFDGEGQPFVAYKSHFTRRAQALVRRAPDARAATNDPRSGLTRTLASLIKTARAPLGRVDETLRDYVFQADVLFTEGDDRRVIEDERITIRPNVLPYVIDKTHPLYAPIRAAKAGVVIHSVGRRKVDGKGRVSTEAVSSTQAEERLVREFVKVMEGTKLFAIHPWRDDVRLAETTAGAIANLNTTVIREAERIQCAVESLSPEFRAEWPKYEPKFRTFLNSGLRPPRDGGFYREAATGQAITPRNWFKEFELWLRGRNEIKLADRFEQFVTERGDELSDLLEAYGAAIHVQAMVMPLLKDAMSSKLGGGEVEGLMLKTDDAVVKLVDRLGFTMRNNASGGPGAAAPRTLDRLPAPFNAWRPGLGVLVGKGQPLHQGHVEMIERAIELNGDQPLVVFASDKQPNLRAKTWKDTKVVELKADAEKRDYVHLFDRKFRTELAEHALRGKDVMLVMGSHVTFWSYLNFARTNGLVGKINYYMGEKEVAEGRYDEQIHEFRDNLTVHPIPAQAEGLSATLVRRAIKTAATEGRRERAAAMKTLDSALAYIPDDLERRRVISRMIARWKRVDRLVQATIPPKPAKKNKKAAGESAGQVDEDAGGAVGRVE